MSDKELYNLLTKLGYEKQVEIKKSLGTQIKKIRFIKDTINVNIVKIGKSKSIKSIWTNWNKTKNVGKCYAYNLSNNEISTQLAILRVII